MTKAEYRTLLVLLNPVAPHITEELWSLLGESGRVYQASWPEYSEEKTVENTITIAIQVNGKLRGTFEAPKDIAKDDAIAMAKEVAADKITGNIVKEIYVPGRLVNIVCK